MFASELNRYERIMNDAKEIKKEKQREKGNKPPRPPPVNSSDTPATLELNKVGSLFIGQPLRLYCPDDNVYHVGRIINFRKNVRPFVATTAPDTRRISAGSSSTAPGGGVVYPVSLNCQPPDEYFGSGPYKELEFLVRFRAGTGGRKVPVHRWIILEEHAVAVSCAVVWGKAPGGYPWWPAQVVVRSCLEKIQSFVCDEHDGVELAGGGEGSAYDEDCGNGTCLALFFGEQTNCELDLPSETANFLSPKFADKRANSDALLCIAVAMAQVELEEQRRVRSWYNLKAQEGGDGVSAVVAASAAVASAEGQGGTRISQDIDMEDEARSKDERDAVRKKFHGKGLGGKEVDDKGEKVMTCPSVPPASTPLVSHGLRSDVLLEMTDTSETGAIGGRKRRKIESVSIEPVSVDNISSLNRRMTRGRGSKAAKT